MTANSAKTLDGIEKPGLAADGQVEATVTVGDNIKPCRFLLGDDAGDGVEILLAKKRVPQGGLEGPAGKAAVEPERTRVGDGDGGGQGHVARDSENEITSIGLGDSIQQLLARQ